MQSTSLNSRKFRHAIGHFATGVTIVTSVDPEGNPVGTTANAVSSLSLDPPLVLVCFALESHTLAAVREHGAFVVNVLAAHQADLSIAFARSGSIDVWADLPHECGHTGAPRLHDVVAHLECVVKHRLAGGDHEIVVGRVLRVATTTENRAPLLFYRGVYARLVAE